MKRTTLLTVSALATAAGFLAFQSANAQHVFWSELDRGEIWTADASGQNAQAIVTGLNRPIGIALDVPNGHMYFVQDGADGAGAVSRAAITGGTVTDIVTGISNPQFIFVQGGRVYWTEFFSASAFGADAGGVNQNISTIFDESTSRLGGIGYDSANSRYYVVNPANGNVWNGNLDGSDVQGPADLFANWAVSGNLEIDGASGLMYRAEGTDIKVSGLDGSNEVTLASGLGLPLGVGLGPDGNLFWGARTDQAIGVVGIDGTGLNASFIDTASVVGADSSPFGIAVIPEPGTYALIFGLGIGALVLLRRRYLRS